MASRRNLTTCGLLGAVFLLLSRLASAPQPTAPSGVGVVTSLQGQATVSRQALPGGSALHFKDDVFFRDQIATRERSTVRLLLGGKGVLTVREQSQVTLDETVAPDGGRRSVLNVLAGKIGAAIAHSLMRPGDEVEIRTPDAVAANRGTTLIVEYDPSQKSAEDSKPVPLAASSSTASPAQAAGASGGQSTFLVLTGSVIVTPRGQPPLPLGSMQSVSITVTSGGVKAGTVQNVTPAQAAQGLQTPKPHTGEAAGDANPEAQARIAAAVADAIVQAVKGEQQQAVAAVPGTAPRPSNTIAPIVPQVSQQQVAAPGSSTTPPSSGTTTPPVPPVVAIGLSPGPLLSLTDLNVGVDAGSPLITFSAGAPNTVTPVAVDAGIITSPLIEATGPTIAHSGPIASLAGSSIVGDQASIGASLVKIGGVPVTNAGGPVFSLGGGSAVSTSGSVLDVGTGGSAELAGLVDITGASTLALSRADGIAVVAGSLTVTDALFKVAGGSSIGTLGGGALAYTDPGILTLHAPILSATDSSIAFTGPVLTATESTVTGDSLGGLVALHNSTLGLTGGALLESQGSTLSFAGAMVRLDQTGSGTASLTSGREGTPLVNLAGDSLTISGTGALLAMNRGRVEVAGSLLSAAGGATLTSTGTTAPLVQLTNGTLSLTNAGSLVSLTGAGATGSGTVLDSGNSTITIDGPIFALRGGSSIAHTGGPVIRLNGGSLTAQGGFVDSDESGNQVTISGALLEATNSNIILGNTRIPKVGPGGTDTIVIAPPAGVPQISLTNGTLTDSSTESLVGFGNGSSTSAGLLLVVAGSAMNLGGELASVENGPDVASTGSAALIQLGGLEMRSNANLVRIEGRGLTLAGPLMTVTGGELDAGKGFLRIAGGGSLIGTSSEPLISLSGTTIIGGSGPGTDTGGAFLNLRTDAESTTASRLALSGPLLKATNSFFDSTDSSFIAIRDNAILTSTSTAPLVELTGSTVEADSSIIRVGPFATNDAGTAILGNGVPPSVSLAGPALRATDTHFTARTGSFLTIRDLVTGRLTGTGPLIELVGTTSGATTVTAPSGNFLTLASARNQPPRLSLPGPLLDAANTAFTVGDPGVSADAFLFVGDGARLAGASRDPLIHLSGSSLSASGSFLAVRRSGATPSTVTLAGPLLSASDTSFTTFNTVSPGGCCAFVFVGEGASLQGDGSGPLLQFNGSTVRMDGALFNLGSGPGQPDSTATLNGPLLTAVNSTFDSGPLSNFVTIHGGATFTSTTTEPLPMVSGGSITTKAHVVRIGLGSPDSQAPVSATLAGPLLLGTDTDISAISGVLTIRDRGTFTSTTTAPLIQLRGTAGSTLALGGPDPDPASPTFGQQLPGQVFAIQPNLATPIAASAELFGPVLSAVNTTITTTDRILRVRGEAGASATLGTEPLREHRQQRASDQQRGHARDPVDEQPPDRDGHQHVHAHREHHAHLILHVREFPEHLLHECFDGPGRRPALECREQPAQRGGRPRGRIRRGPAHRHDDRPADPAHRRSTCDRQCERFRNGVPPGPERGDH